MRSIASFRQTLNLRPSRFIGFFGRGRGRNCAAQGMEQMAKVTEARLVEREEILA
jgi:hypothetical protein